MVFVQVQAGVSVGGHDRASVVDQVTDLLSGNAAQRQHHVVHVRVRRVGRLFILSAASEAFLFVGIGFYWFSGRNERQQERERLSIAWVR